MPRPNERARPPVARRFELAESIVLVGLVAIPTAALLSDGLELLVGPFAYALFAAVLAAWLVALLVFDSLSYEPGSTGEYDAPSGAGCVAVMFATVGGLLALLARGITEGRHSGLASAATGFFTMLMIASAVAWIGFLVMIARERLSGSGP